MGGTLELSRSASESGADDREARLSAAPVDGTTMQRQPPLAKLAGLRLALAGGGTGGHIVPGRHLLAHAGSELGDVLWFCTGRPVEERAFEGLDRFGTPIERVALHLEPDGGGAPSAAGLALRTLPAIRAARAALREHQSEVLLGLGGFTSLPAVLAARWLRIPVALIEINAAPGKATRRLAPLATRVFHAWQGTLPHGAESRRDLWTGPPLAPAFVRGRVEHADATSARAALGFAAARPLVVVIGGSQGAGALNKFVSAHVDEFLRRDVQVLHQTGPGKLEQGAEERFGYRRVEFIADVHLALCAATIVLCRGGASTLAEVAAVRRPAWVVPYPHHRDRQQERNARELGAGVEIVAEERLNAAFARELVAMTAPASAAVLEGRALELERCLPLDASERIWRELLRLVPGRSNESGARA